MTQTAATTIEPKPDQKTSLLKEEYYAAGNDLISRKMDELFGFAGLEGSEAESEIEDVHYRRSKATLDVSFNLYIGSVWERINGRSDGTLPITNNEGVDKAFIEFYKNAVSEMTSTEYLRDRVQKSKFKAEEIVNTYLTVTEATCGGCHGDGEVSCSGCGGNGSVRCPAFNCGFSGYVRCGHCHGVGYFTSPEDSRVTANCGRCHGSGQHRCFTCGGATTVRCSGCRGSGSCRCGGCDGYGLHSTFHGAKVELTPSMKVRETDFMPDELEEVQQWIATGMRGAVKESHETLPHTTLWKQEAYRQKGGDENNIKVGISFKACATVVCVKGKVFKQDVTARYMKLSEPWFRLNNFMDALMKKPRLLAADMKEKTPKEFLDAMKQFPALHQAITFCWSGRNVGVDSFLMYIDMTSHGGMTQSGVRSIATDYQESINSFSKAVYRNTATAPIVALIVIWSLMQSMGYPAAIMDSLIGLAAYTLIPAWVSLLITRFIARKKMKEQTGNKKLASVCKEAYLIPFCGAILFGLTAFAGVDIWPENYALWPILEQLERTLGPRLF